VAATGPVPVDLEQPFETRMTGLISRNSPKRNFWFIVSCAFFDFENMNPLFLIRLVDGYPVPIDNNPQ
jgi:hypothetical protein